MPGRSWFLQTLYFGLAALLSWRALRKPPKGHIGYLGKAVIVLFHVVTAVKSCFVTAYICSSGLPAHLQAGGVTHTWARAQSITILLCQTTIVRRLFIQVLL